MKSRIAPSGQTTEEFEERNYIGGAEFVNEEIESIHSEEGRIAFEENEEPYVEYYLKDHLGNTRVRLADKDHDNLVTVNPKFPEKDEVMSSHHYYPFGMEWDTPDNNRYGNTQGSTGVDERYNYNGKEIIYNLDLNLLDYGFRYFDPAIARFTTIDPLANINHYQSHYVYADNNPVNFIDFMGLSATYNWDTGRYENEEGKEVSWDDVNKDLNKKEDNEALTSPDDIIILYSSIGGHGHMAMLVGSDEKGWDYLSKDGAADGVAWNGSPKAVEKPFNTFEDFLNDGLFLHIKALSD